MQAEMQVLHPVNAADNAMFQLSSGREAFSGAGEGRFCATADVRGEKLVAPPMASCSEEACHRTPSIHPMPRANARNSRFFWGLMESAASPSIPRGAIIT